MPALVERLKKSSPEDSLWVGLVQALGRIGAAARPALPILERYARRADPEPAPKPPTYPGVVAAGAVAQIDGATEDRVAVLLDALAAPAPGEKGRAALSEPTIEAAVSLLQQLQGGMPPQLESQVARALARALARDELAFVQERIVACLVRMGTASPEVVPALAAALGKARAAFDAAPSGSVSAGTSRPGEWSSGGSAPPSRVRGRRATRSSRRSGPSEGRTPRPSRLSNRSRRRTTSSCATSRTGP